MALAYTRDNLEGLDDGVASLYVKQDDGIFKLDVQGVAPKSKVDEFRDKNVALLKEMDKYKGIDIEKYQELEKERQQLEDQELIKSGDVEKLVERRIASINEEHTATVNGLNDQLSTTNRRLESLLIDSAVRDASGEAGVLASAVNDVMLRAKSVYAINPKTGEAEGKTPKGELLYARDGVTPLPVTDWVKSLKKEAPHLFASSTGGNAPGGQVHGQMDTSKMTPLDKISTALNTPQ